MESLPDAKRESKDFIFDLESTALQINEVLEQLNASKIDFIHVKVELTNIVRNLRDLSYLIKLDSGELSIPTRLLEVESSIQKIELWIIKQEALQSKEMVIDNTKEMNKLQITIAMTFGIISLIVSAAAFFVNY